MASWMDVPVRLHIRIQTLRLISDRGEEKREEGGGRRSRGRERVGIDGSIVLGTMTGIGNEIRIGKGKESETGTGIEKEARNGIRGGRVGIVKTGIDTTVARGSIGGETTNGAVRLLPPMDPPPLS